MKSVKIGFAPTRRSIFSAPDAVKYANLTRERLKELGVEFVDITDINEEGLFYDEADREKIQEKFRRENVKGIFFPHGNFGTEYVECEKYESWENFFTELLVTMTADGVEKYSKSTLNVYYLQDWVIAKIKEQMPDEIKNKI